MEFLTYLFWPNPPAPSYQNPKIMVLLLVSLVFLAGSFAIKHWRKKQTSSVTKKLSRTWPGAALWFGLIGLFLTICRVEGISYLSMRVWWGVWAAGLLLFAFFQFKMFRMRNYEVLPQEQVAEDPKDKYLPKKKKK